MGKIEDSELIINDDGSIFHLHITPEQLAEKIILVGDPGRVELVASHFEKKDCDVQSREFHTITGLYKGKRVSCISTGIGCDNIDIVVNEIDALTNIDFETREIKKNLKSLDIVRIGTCGGIQPFTPTGTFVVSQKSIGFDGLLNFYKGRNEVCDIALEEKFKKHMSWNPQLADPYIIEANKELTERIAQQDMVRGITISCGGFYGPQGRELRIPLADPDQNKKLGEFEDGELRITNIEMESSALAGLSRLLGHAATTCCMVIANRKAKKADTNYKNKIDDLIKLVLERI